VEAQGPPDFEVVRREFVELVDISGTAKVLREMVTSTFWLSQHSELVVAFACAQ